MTTEITPKIQIKSDARADFEELSKELVQPKKPDPVDEMMDEDKALKEWEESLGTPPEVSEFIIK